MAIIKPLGEIYEQWKELGGWKGLSAEDAVESFVRYAVEEEPYLLDMSKHEVILAPDGTKLVYNKI